MRNCLNLLLLAVLFFAVNSCKKHETIIQDPIVPYDAGTAITTAIAGKVTAQDGTALNGVEIAIGTSTTITDVGGNFIIPQANINQKAGLIKATKTGYFAGSRTIIAKEKVINNIVIQLVKKTQTGSFSNATGGTITIATGGSIVFPANAVATKSGAAYTGTVKVSAYFLDPTSANCFKEMPGDLRGINTSNNEQVLTSYGMMAVELQGSNGEALQIATGKTATLIFPIATSIQANAPATIPLWFFDETKGMWVEQGTATKTDNNYVGSVSHFTWWNCDWGGGPIELTTKFIDQNGNPLCNYDVYYVASAGVGGGHGFTATDGSLTGNIPANKPITIKVIPKIICIGSNAALYSKTFESFSQNTNLGAIVVNIPNINAQTITIKATVVNCNNIPVTNGYAIITIGTDKYYENIVNGAISKSVIFCNPTTATASIDVFDLDSSIKNPQPIDMNINGAGVYDFGELAACGLSTLHFCNASYNAEICSTNKNSWIEDAYGTLSSTTILCDLINPKGQHLLRLDFKGINVGYFSTKIMLSEYYSGVAYASQNDSYVHITEYGQVGQYIAGNFWGSIKDTTSRTLHPNVFELSGTFRIKRTH